MTRPLLLALVASVAVHGLALALAPRLAPRASPAGAVIDLDVIEAVGGEAAAGEVAPVAGAARPPRSAPEARRSAEPERSEAPPGAFDPARADTPHAGAPVAATPPAGAPAADAVPPGAVLPAGADGIPVAVAIAGSPEGGERGPGGGLAGPGRGAPATTGGAPGSGGDSLHGAILARLRARTTGCYPRAAVRRAVEGVARVSFCVRDGGEPADLRLVASSGSALLDDAALSCVVRGAAPLPGAGACVQVPIDFHLRR